MNSNEDKNLLKFNSTLLSLHLGIVDTLLQSVLMIGEITLLHLPPGNIHSILVDLQIIAYDHLPEHFLLLSLGNIVSKIDLNFVISLKLPNFVSFHVFHIHGGSCAKLKVVDQVLQVCQLHCFSNRILLAIQLKIHQIY